MSDMITLAAEVREAGKNLQTLRNQGLIPAVLYGRGIESQSVSVDHRAFARAFKAAGENTIIALSMGKGKAVNVIVKDAQLDPLSNRFTHADFFQVRMDEAIDADIPLEFVGEAPAVREAGGVLVKALEAVLVNSLPGDLPHAFSVDLSKLATFDDVIKIKDLAIPARVTVKDDLETVVALVEAPRSEAELEKLNEKAEADVTKVEKADEKKPEESASDAK